MSIGTSGVRFELRYGARGKFVVAKLGTFTLGEPYYALRPTRNKFVY